VGFNACPAFVTVLKVNGQVELQTAVTVCGSAADLSTVASVPNGFTAQGGDTIEPVGPVLGTGRAWGYLADQ
jgi:hypothetical protein